MDLVTLSLFAIFALFLAGTVKGAVGLGLPTTAVGFLSLALDPRSAIALALIPMLITNIWQLYRAGEIRRTIRRYLPFSASLFVVAFVTLVLTTNAPERVLLAVLGVMMLIYVGVSVTRWAPQVPDRLDRLAQLIAGSVSGVAGGLVGIWAPPMAVYLTSRQTSKEEFIRAGGLILAVGSAPVVVGYIQAGFLVPPLIAGSILLLIPTFAGFALGERLRGRLSEEGFRRALMVFFALMGLNLLRRAFL